MTIDEIADALERDRREPDKVLCYVQSLRRMALKLRDVNEWANKPEGDARLRMTEARELLRSVAGNAR